MGFKNLPLPWIRLAVLYRWPHLEAAKKRPTQIVEFQNSGDITRICTYAMADQFEKDLRVLTLLK